MFICSSQIWWHPSCVGPGLDAGEAPWEGWPRSSCRPSDSISPVGFPLACLPAMETRRFLPAFGLPSEAPALACEGLLLRWGPALCRPLLTCDRTLVRPSSAPVPGSHCAYLLKQAWVPWWHPSLFEDLNSNSPLRGHSICCCKNDFKGHSKKINKMTISREVFFFQEKGKAKKEIVNIKTPLL